VAVTDDLRQAFLEATGENLDWFWNQWMYQAGLAEFTVTAKWDSSMPYMLTVEQTQLDSATADSTGLRYTFPLRFRMPVEVRVRTAAGDYPAAHLARAAKPDHSGGGSFVVAPDGGVRRRQHHLQDAQVRSAECLARGAVVRDENLWNRWWAIGELAHGTSDSTAARALAKRGDVLRLLPHPGAGLESA
jgi:hypothetical protein